MKEEVVTKSVTVKWLVNRFTMQTYHITFLLSWSHLCEYIIGGISLKSDFAVSTMTGTSGLINTMQVDHDQRFSWHICFFSCVVSNKPTAPVYKNSLFHYPKETEQLNFFWYIQTSWLKRTTIHAVRYWSIAFPVTNQSFTFSLTAFVKSLSKG